MGLFLFALLPSLYSQCSVDPSPRNGLELLPRVQLIRVFLFYLEYSDLSITSGSYLGCYLRGTELCAWSLSFLVYLPNGNLG